jgi:hypothetical protein
MFFQCFSVRPWSFVAAVGSAAAEHNAFHSEQNPRRLDLEKGRLKLERRRWSGKNWQ